jgi:DNA primase large subunit
MAVRGPSTHLDAGSLFAEYPFLPGAEAILGSEPVSVGALLQEPAYERPRAIGRARILAAADDPRGERTVEELAGASGDVRYLSFLFARLVLASAPSLAVLRRWAVSEAKRSYGRLAAAEPEELEEVARRLGYPIERRARRMTFELTDYLRLSVAFREADFRLARQDVERGRVTVESVRAARLLQEAIRRTLAVPLPLTVEVVTLVRDRESELLGTVAERMPKPVARAGSAGARLSPERFPPCIRRMQRTLERGENLSHAGRFCLAAFLHRAGADLETIVDAYRGAPDFDESITRYQVEHITSRGGGEGYEPPECDTLRSHGLCARDGDPDSKDPAERRRDELCFRPVLKHPLQYYRIRGGVTVERAVPDVTTEERGPGTSAGRGRTPSTARR